MPIDTSMYRPYQPEQTDLIGNYARMISLRQMMDEAPLRRQRLQQEIQQTEQQHQLGQQTLRANQMKFDDHERAQASMKSAQQIIARYKGNVEQAMSDAEFLQTVDPSTMKTFKDGHVATQKSYADLDDQKFKTAAAKGEATETLYNRATTMPEGDYIAAWPQIVAAVKQINPDMQLPEQPIPQAALRRHFGLPILTQKYYLDAETNRRNNALHQPALAKANTEATVAQLGLAARNAGSIANQPQWDAFRASLPPAIQAQVPAMFSPAAAEQVRRLGMTVSEQEAGADRDASRLQAAQHHTDQVNLTREGHNITKRGQNMTDDRQRDLNEISRNNKPPTEAESRNWGFYTRANDAEAALSTLEPSVREKGRVGQAYQKYAPNVIQTGENQSYDQSKRQFVAAYLRRDSGAVISPSEFADADKTFFPQPGDSKEVQAQKQQARKRVIETLKVGAGRAYAQNGDGSTPPQQPNNAGHVNVTDPNGTVHTFADQASANRFKQLAGIK